MNTVLWDLNGCLIHNNKSLGTGDLPEGYGADDPNEIVRACENGELPRAYYLTSREDIVWVDGALEAIARLHKAGFQQHVITNQEHVGLLITDGELDALFKYMNSQIEEADGAIGSWWYCPHSPGEGCLCRKRTEKPGLSLFYGVAATYGFNLYDAYMVGDNISDMTSGRLACCTTIMIKTPKEYSQELIGTFVDYTAHSLKEVADYILGREGLEDNG